MTLKGVRVTIVSLQKQYLLYILSVCVCERERERERERVDLAIQHAVRMRHIIICGLSRSTKFFRVCHKRYDFWNKGTEHKVCVLISIQLMAENFLILRRTERDVIKMYIDLYVKYRLLLLDFNVT